jgi:hypothetical protein
MRAAAAIKGEYDERLVMNVGNFLDVKTLHRRKETRCRVIIHASHQ